MPQDGTLFHDCPEKMEANLSKPNPFRKGHVNHVNMEEVMEETDAVIGTFQINSFLALVLFDTGASHSFISRDFVDRDKIPARTTDRPIKISSPGGEMLATMGCNQLVLQIGSPSFPTSLIVLESQGLDVILGMDWMTTYEGVIDCAKRAISLTTPGKK